MSMYYNAGEGLQCVQGCIVCIHYNAGRKAHYNVGRSCNAPGCTCIIIVWYTHCNVGVENITICHITTAGLHYNAATWTVAQVIILSPPFRMILRALNYDHMYHQNGCSDQQKVQVLGWCLLCGTQQILHPYNTRELAEEGEGYPGCGVCNTHAWTGVSTINRTNFMFLPIGLSRSLFVQHRSKRKMSQYP